MNKIPRYNIYAYADDDDKDSTFWEAEERKHGDFVYAEDVINFVKQL